MLSLPVVILTPACQPSPVLSSPSVTASKPCLRIAVMRFPSVIGVQALVPPA